MPALRPPLLPSSKVALAEVKAALAAAGYTESGLRDRLSLQRLTPVRYFAALADPPYVREEAPTPLDQLLRLLLCGQKVGRRAIDGALGPKAVAAMKRVRLLVPSGSDYRATAAVLPFGELCFCCDFQGSAADRVCFPDPSAMAGVQLLAPGLRDQRRVAICLQAGFGLHAVALKAVYGFEEVHVTGESRRSSQLTRLNAALNGVTLQLDGEIPQGSADLVVAVLSGVFRSSRLWSNHAPGSEDERSLDLAWGQVESLLAPAGRALLCHETRLVPPDWLPKKIATRLGLGSLEVVWVPALGQGPGADERIEHGVTVVRRAQPGALPLVRAGSFAGQPGSSARGLELHLETRRLLRELDEAGFEKLVPYRNARAAVAQSFESQPGQPLAPSIATVGASAWPAEAVAVMSRCDNARTVAQIADGDRERANLLRRLALEGVVFLRA